MITMMKIMRKRKIIIIIIKKSLKEKQTNKQMQQQPMKRLYIRDKTLTVEERQTEKKNTHLLHPDYKKRLPCLICSVNITFIKTKRSICL